MHLLSNCLGNCNTAAFDDNVYILAWTAKETVTDISTDDKGSDTLLCGSFRNYPENLMIEKTVCYC